METSAGRFCRFKPRSKWPPELQKSIPGERLYFIHPVIIIRGIVDGMVDVVTTTSSPALDTNHNNYIRISTIDPRSSTELNAPLIVNLKLPKESWAVLDSKRQFPITILEPWIENVEQFKIGYGSTKRLLQKVNERTAAKARSTTASEAAMAVATAARAPGTVPPPPPLKPPTTTSTNPYARAMAPSGPPPSVPLPSLPSLRLPASAALFTLGKPPSPPPRTTSLPLAAAPTSSPDGEDIDIEGIKKSLAGLKVAVAALEGLCEKLEGRTGSPSARPVSPAPELSPGTPPAPLIARKASRILGIPSESEEMTGCDEALDKDGRKTEVGGTRARLKRWRSRLFMTRDSQ